MKPFILIIFSLVFCITNIAAQTKDYQKQMDDAKKQLEKIKSDPALRKKMEEAQQQLNRIKADPEMQKQMAQAASVLDSMKKLHPELAQVKMPDLGAAQIPNIESLTKNIDANLSKISQFSKGYFDALDKTMPKQNMLRHAEKLPLLTSAASVIMARGVLKNIKPNLNIIEVTNLDKIVADTNTNAAGTGAIYLSTGASKNAAVYLICKGILKNPKDAWAINALGVYFRDEMLYEKSLQCYFYANDLDAGKSSEINTNIGWASAYYGDFDAAQKYFEKALSIQKDYNSALEGEALLAYRKGDLPALFKCLAKQIKTFGGAGHSGGPSEAFTSLCGGISNENNNINLDTQPDPTNDHTYDNPAADEDGAQDPPPGADAEDINYPSYRPIFVKDAKEIYMAAPLAAGFFKQSFEKRKRYLQEASEKLKSLKPLGQTPYIDDEGFLVFEHSFKKFVDLFEPVTMLFERRIVWYKQKYEKEIHPLLLSIGLSDVDLCKRYYAALAACSGNAACFQRVNCEWLPRLHGSKNADLEAITRIWSKYSDNIRSAIQWYADATTPYISRVHDVGWNEYLNMRREFAVRGAILESYDEWGSALMMINTGVCGIIQQPMPVCQAKLRILDGGGPDPFAKKPKHLKTFAGPCYTEPVSRDIVFAFYENNCQHTIYGIGTPAFRAFHEEIYSKKFKEDNKPRRGFIIGTSKSFGIDEKAGDNITGQATAKADLELEAQAKFYHEFNSEGVMTETGTEINVSAKGTIEVSVNAGPVSVKAGQSLGIEAGMNVKVVGGQAQIAGITGQISH